VTKCDKYQNYQIQQIIIITTNGFTKDIWDTDTAKANSIRLLTEELEHQIVS
jgi:hypothetical protein